LVYKGGNSDGTSRVGFTTRKYFVQYVITHDTQLSKFVDGAVVVSVLSSIR